MRIRRKMNFEDKPFNPENKTASPVEVVLKILVVCERGQERSRMAASHIVEWLKSIGLAESVVVEAKGIGKADIEIKQLKDNPYLAGYTPCQAYGEDYLTADIIFTIAREQKEWIWRKFSYTEGFYGRICLIVEDGNLEVEKDDYTVINNSTYFYLEKKVKQAMPRIERIIRNELK